MISLGQSNTIVSCPALTTHSELDEAALAASGMTPTTIRFAVGDEDVFDLIQHLLDSAHLTIDPDVAWIYGRLPNREEIQRLIRDCYVQSHSRYIEQRLAEAALDQRAEPVV